MKIGIIGGGAAGLMVASLLQNNDYEVIIFERNQECGKKILATGNGRCNYWNSNQDLCHYQSSTPELISSFIDIKDEQLILSFFAKLGIIPRIKEGYYYPFSNQASTIRNVLLNKVKANQVIIKNNFLVKQIKRKDDKFIIISNSERIVVDRLILASGSYASPKTGSDGMGYDFLKSFGHTIIKPLPALVQLKGDGNYFKSWNGIRTHVKVSLYENNFLVREEEGEIQLTDYGVSGICVFNLSNYIARGLEEKKREYISINFLPFVTSNFNNWFLEQTKLTNKNILELLSSILNLKLVDVLLKLIKIDSCKKFNELNYDEKNRLVDVLTNFKVLINGTKTYNEAQVCSGGVSLKEINLSTMESKLVKNLYVIGELLDITGDCGGYNLGIAWRSSLRLVRALEGEQND